MFAVGLTAILTVAVTVFAEDARPVASATTQRSSPADIAKWFTQLADDDPATRDAARINLMGLKRDQLDDLRQVVEENKAIAPAQSTVLHDIVCHVFLTGEDYEKLPNGFMGVILLPVLQPPAAPRDEAADEARVEFRGRTGVRIAQRVPGFCGFRYLQEDDLVIAVMATDVVRITEVQELMALVRGTAPGETISLQLIRQGKSMRVAFKLDAKPAETIAQNQVEEFRNPRLSKAEEYWQKVFAPLVTGKLS